MLKSSSLCDLVCWLSLCVFNHLIFYDIKSFVYHLAASSKLHIINADLVLLLIGSGIFWLIATITWPSSSLSWLILNSFVSWNINPFEIRLVITSVRWFHLIPVAQILSTGCHSFSLVNSWALSSACCLSLSMVMTGGCIFPSFSCVKWTKLPMQIACSFFLLLLQQKLCEA